jgi:rod shape-determining protein MreD
MTVSAANAVRLVVLGLITLLAQIVIAPNVRVAGAVPDLVLIVVVIQAVRLSQTSATIFGFCLGLLFDIMATGPFGLMTLILTLIALVVSSLNKGTFTEHWIAEMLLVMLAVLFGELLYSVAAALVNPDLDFAASLLYIVLPTTIYNIIISLVIISIGHLLGSHRGSNAAYGSGGSARASRLGAHSAADSFSSGSARNSGRSSGRSLSRNLTSGSANRPSGQLSGLSGKRLGGKLPGGGGKIPGRPINRKLR